MKVRSIGSDVMLDIEYEKGAVVDSVEVVFVGESCFSWAGCRGVFVQRVVGPLIL